MIAILLGSFFITGFYQYYSRHGAQVKKNFLFKGGLAKLKNSMCALLGTPPNLVIVYTALKPRHRRTLTIVIESAGKILFWKKKNTNSGT